MTASETSSAALLACQDCRGRGRDPLDSTMSCHRCGGVKVIRMSEKAEGLLPKYTVQRNNDEAGKHDDCRYFVLDPLHDPIARSVLATYGGLARMKGYDVLARDISEWLRSLPEQEDRDV